MTIAKLISARDAVRPVNCQLNIYMSIFHATFFYQLWTRCAATPYLLIPSQFRRASKWSLHFPNWPFTRRLSKVRIRFFSSVYRIFSQVCYSSLFWYVFKWTNSTREWQVLLLITKEIKILYIQRVIDWAVWCCVCLDKNVLIIVKQWKK